MERSTVYRTGYEPGLHDRTPHAHGQGAGGEKYFQPPPTMSTDTRELDQQVIDRIFNTLQCTRNRSDTLKAAAILTDLYEAGFVVQRDGLTYRGQ